MTCSFTLLLLLLSGWRLRVGAPEFDLVLQLDSLFAPHALTNLFRQRQRIFRARVLAFRDDEVSVNRRDHRAAATLSFHSHLIDDLAGADRARRRVLEKTTRGT